VSRPPAVRVERPRRLSRPDRARAALAYLSRVMRPATIAELALVVGVTYSAMQNAVTALYDPWFRIGGGTVWITEAGWRERLAGHPSTRGE
jgi:hypothetical protein